MKTRLYLAGETAFILRQALGNWREWSDCRADMRSDETSFAGLKLCPIAQVFDGRRYRPMYHPDSIREFILAVLKQRPEIVGMDRSPQAIEIDLDPHDVRSWRVRKINPTIH